MFSSSSRTLLASVTDLQVDSVTFPPSIVSLDSSNSLFLGGAGVQGLNMQGGFVISTVIGVYLDPETVPSLFVKWKGKTTEELTESVSFFHEIVTGSFEKLIMVKMKQPITGQQFSTDVTEKCEAIWESLGLYPDSDISNTRSSPGPHAKMRFNKITRTFGAHGSKERQYSRGEAVKRFLEIFKNKKFPAGASIVFALSPTGSLTVAFSNDDSFLKTGKTVIDNKAFAEAVLESIIGKNGVSPGARLSVALRLAQLMEIQGRIRANSDETKNKVKEDASNKG